MKRLAAIASAALALIMGTASLSAETLRWGSPSQGYPPLKLARDAGASGTGILNDVTLAVVEAMGYRGEIVWVPTRRNWRMFGAGELDLVAMMDPSWMTPERHAAGKMSDPVLPSQEVVVLHAERAIDFGVDFSGLHGRAIATKRGFTYRGQEHWREVEAPSILAQLQLVARGRAEAAVANPMVARWLIRANGIENLRFGPVYTDGTLRIVVGNRRLDLLEPMNATIARLRADGTIDRIVADYLGPGYQ